MLDTSQISKYCFPKDVLFLFQNEQKAKLCMEKFFPDYHNISNEDIRIRIQIMQFSNIDWNFQSSIKAQCIKLDLNKKSILEQRNVGSRRQKG